MKNLTDDRLITLYEQGKNEAFDELLNRYKEKLYTYIYVLVQNREMAEDIFQDTFTKVIVTIKQGRYNEKGRFLGFLFRVAHNLIVDIYRQEQYAQFVNPTDAGYDIFNDKELCAPSFEDQMSDQQIKQDVRRLIRYLPECQQEIIMMRFYRGMSFKEIADIKKISINTALGRVRYAILNMRKMAEQHNITLAG
jgi:RNA polymerase sigma-70 factor (ECF subfamily)